MQLNLFNRVKEQRTGRKVKTAGSTQVCVICGDHMCAKRECVNLQTALNARENEPSGLKKIWAGSPFCLDCGAENRRDCVCD